MSINIDNKNYFVYLNEQHQGPAGEKKPGQSPGFNMKKHLGSDYQVSFTPAETDASCFGKMARELI